MNISKMLAWSAGAALVVTGAVLAAQGFGPGMGGGYGGMMGGGYGQGRYAEGGPMARFLNLTEAQQKNLKAIQDHHQATLEAKFKAADEARDAMHDAMSDPATSDAKVQELHAKMADAMTALMLERRAMDREFQAILTPEQKATLVERGTRGRHRWDRMGWGMGQGWGPGGCGF